MKRTRAASDARLLRGVAAGLALALVLTFAAAAVLGEEGTKLHALLVGARITLSVAVVVTGVSFFLGVSVGGLAALGPAPVDALLSRAMEMGGALPSLVVVAVFRGLGVTGALSPALVVAALRSLEVAKAVRSDVRQLAAEEFVLAARSSGASRFRIFHRHLVPHLSGPALAQAATVAAAYVSLDAAASFIGLGAPGPGLGALIADAGRGASVALGLVAAAGTAGAVAALSVLADALGKRHSVPRRFV